MLRNVFLVSLLIYAVCAVPWEIHEEASAEDELEEILGDSLMKEQIFKCEMCKSIMKQVKKRISSKTTLDDIKQKMNNTCQKTLWMKEDCKLFVKKHLHTLLDELMTEDGPKTICTKIHACKRKLPKELSPDQDFNIF